MQNSSSVPDNDVLNISAKRTKIIDKTQSLNNEYNIENLPLIITSYKDPSTRYMHLSILGLMMSGATEPRFELNEQGSEASISYFWPNCMVHMTEVFHKINVFDTHPRLIATKEALENLQENIEDIPKMIVNVKLPFAVLTDKCHIKREGVKIKDVKFFLIDLMAPPNDFVSKYSDSLIQFKE